MTGIRLAQRLRTSQPMVITPQQGTWDNLPINRETFGLEDTKTGPPNQLQPENIKETDLREL